MEAVPKLPLICFELKVSTENTHFGPKLKQYIAEAYREDPDSYNNEMHQLEGLRSAAVRPSSDAAGLNALKRYFFQLRAIQSRFPMAKGQPAACTFTWKDLYANSNCSLSDIRFEMACILYNIGAFHTLIGVSEPRTSAESLKSACTHFKTAAWAFQHLREQYPQLPGIDVSSEIVRLLQEICLAQAQECILYKCIQDTKKPSVVGAVATQVLYFYRNSMSLLGPSTGSDNIHEVIGTKLYNYWYRYLSFKVYYIGCIVNLYQGMNAEEQQKMGERIAYYQQALENLNEARKLAKFIEPVQLTNEALVFTNDIVEAKRKAAKNENEFIYHEEIPEKDMLSDLKPVCLVEVQPINMNDPEVEFQDIFSRLVPMGAHEASSMYSEEKAKLLRHVVGQAETKNTELTQFMSSLQLDQLEVLDSDQKIPQEIVDRCAAMNAKPDIIQTLVDSMNNLAEIITDVEHSLGEIKALIQEETMKEKEYQKTMGHRPPSIVQTELSREYHKYQEAYARTNESNQVLHKAMTLHIANLRLLAQPLDVLENKIPSIENIEGLDRETMREMRRVVGKAREMQTQRDSLIQQLREAVTSDDITAKLLARGSETTEEIFKQELEKHTPQVKIIEQNLFAQENIINKLTSLYAAYGESRRLLSDVLRKREGLINALITSYDTHEELLGKCHQGLDFYKKLSHNVTQLLTRVRSTCQVQEEERAQLLAKQTTKLTPSPPVASSAASKVPDVSGIPPPVSAGSNLKLKDYLPYMKSRGFGRSLPPQVPVEPVSTDNFYPETIYPTTARPPPLGSEASEITQPNLPDGVIPNSAQNYANSYNRYGTYPNQIDPYAVNPNYAYPNKPEFDNKVEEMPNYGYSTSYTPAQYSSQIPNQQIYSNPYYAATPNNPTIVTDSQPYNTVVQENINPSSNTFNTYGSPYGQQTMSNHPATSMATYNPNNQTELNMNFAQMQVSVPKSEPVPNLPAEYGQTFYSAQYPNSQNTNSNTYSNAQQNINTNIVQSQTADYNSLNYPYSSDPNQFNQYSANPNMPASSTMPVQNAPVFDSVSQGYTGYNNANTNVSLPQMPSAAAPISTGQTYNYSTDNNIYANPTALSQIDAMDKPIKSFARGEALSSSIPFQPVPYQTYDNNIAAPMTSYANPIEQNIQPTNLQYQPQDQSTNLNYQQNFQNHPGYTFNNATGGYDYSYGSQSSGYANVASANIDPQLITNDQNWQNNTMYTNAGICETLQSPSENHQTMPPNLDQVKDQNYYNLPYGYQTTTNQSVEIAPTAAVTTNYGANTNQSVYMQSGQGQDTNVTYGNNQGKDLL